MLAIAPTAAYAQPEEPSDSAQPAPAEASTEGPAATEPAEEGWGDQKIQGARSKAPATGEPYRWRQMLVAGVIVAAMVLVIVWLVRRSRAR